MDPSACSVEDAALTALDEGSMLAISDSGRYFTENGKPCFWLGDTQWNLFRCHRPESARDILADRRDKGFNVVQVMLLGFAREVMGPAVAGEAFPNSDPRTPNPDYFSHVDAAIDAADSLGLTLAIGLDHPSIKLIALSDAHGYGRWIAARYRDRPNLIWIPSYAIPNAEHLPVMRAIVAGLRESDRPDRLITSHPDPAHPVISSSVAHTEPWLAFNCIQTFAATHLLYSSVAADYARSPVKPVVMAEGAYEAGTEYGFPVTPLVVRRQAYASVLAGGFHSYGHNDSWRVLPTWRDALDAPGARQMTILRSIFESLSWWDLVPDTSAIAEGAGSGETANLTARAGTGAWIFAYLSSPSRVSLKLMPRTRYRATWIDPRTAERAPLGTATEATPIFTTPSGWEDAVLILEREG